MIFQLFACLRHWLTYKGGHKTYNLFAQLHIYYLSLLLLSISDNIIEVILPFCCAISSLLLLLNFLFSNHDQDAFAKIVQMCHGNTVLSIIYSQWLLM